MRAMRPTSLAKPERFIAAFAARGLWEHLEGYRITLRDLERESGVRIPPPENLLAVLPEADLRHVFATAARMTDDRALGLSAANAISESSLHMIGHLIMETVTLREASEFVISIQPRLLGGAACFVREVGEVALLGLEPDRDRDISTGARVQTELIIALMFKFVRPFFATANDVLEVQFALPPPRDSKKYTDFFGATVTFDAPCSALKVPRSLLDRKRLGRDPALFQSLRKLFDAQFEPPEQTFNWRERVRRVLRGYDAPANVQGPAICRSLGISPRAMRRHLGLEGTSLTTLVDEECFERAKHALTQTDQTIAELAAALGYSEVGSFYRAFRRWSGGSTPGAWRTSGRASG